MLPFIYLYGASVADGIGTALDGVKSDALTAISSVAPAGVAIMGAFLVWRYGIRFFKSIAK